MIIERSEFFNIKSIYGGALYLTPGVHDESEFELRRNRRRLDLIESFVRITQSTFSGNSASNGGGIFIDSIKETQI